MIRLKELNRDRQLCEITGDDLCEVNRKIDEFFDELFDNMVIKEKGNRVYFTKNEECYMEQNNRDKTLYVPYDKTWAFFSETIGLVYSDIQVLIQSRIREQYDIIISTPKPVWNYKSDWLKEKNNITNLYTPLWLFTNSYK